MNLIRRIIGFLAALIGLLAALVALYIFIDPERRNHLCDYRDFSFCKNECVEIQTFIKQELQDIETRYTTLSPASRNDREIANFLDSLDELSLANCDYLVSEKENIINRINHFKHQNNIQ